MVGVNNRNLGTFVTDVENSFHIAENSGRYRPQPRILPIAQACRYLFRKAEFHIPKPFAGCAAAGFRGFLIGETFMKTRRPGDALKDFISPLRS